MSDSKHDIIQSVLSTLRSDLDVLRNAALETHKNSTDEQSKAEGKYDTRGLEASYLAEAQAEKVIQLEENIRKLEQISTDDFDDSEPIPSGAMVIVSGDADDLGYFILPAGGGTSVSSQGLDFTIITPVSPIGAQLVGQHIGDSVELPNGESAFISDFW